MDFSTLAVSLISVVAGIVGAELVRRVRDRARPAISLIRLARSRKVPPGLEGVLAQIPQEIASRYNNHPAVPGGVQGGKAIPLDAYLDQLHTLSETVRIEQNRQAHAMTAIAPLLAAISANDQARFFDVLAEHQEYLIGVVHGRIRRGSEPPACPGDVVELDAMDPNPGFSVSTDKDGDLILSRSGGMLRLGLIWTTEPAADKRSRLKRGLHAFARDIVEWRTDELRALFEAVREEVRGYDEELVAIRALVAEEENQYAFLAASILVRNRGSRTFCIDPEATLFLRTEGYSYVVAGTERVLSGDLEVQVAAVVDDADGPIAVAKGETVVVQFSSRHPIGHVEDGVLERLAESAERGCYAGLVMYGEAAEPTAIHTSDTPFRMRRLSSKVPART